MFINEKLQIEEYFYPLAEQNNPIFQYIISSVKKKSVSSPGCYAHMTEWNFRSKEIVTHGELSADRCAAVPAPASTKADRYPPCVIPAAFK